MYKKVAFRRVYSFHQLFVRLPFKVDSSLPNTIYAVIGLYFTMVHEIERLKNMSMMNGYTSQLLESKLSVFLNNKFKECSRDNDEEDSVSDQVFGPDKFKVDI